MFIILYNRTRKITIVFLLEFPYSLFLVSKSLVAKVNIDILHKKLQFNNILLYYDKITNILNLELLFEINIDII